MAQQPGSKEQLERFIAQRADAKNVLATRLVTDAGEVRNLDQHLKGFLKQLQADAKEHEIGLLKKHAAIFEEEVHDELELLFKSVRQDILLLQRVLHALTTYRSQLRDLLEDPQLSSLAHSEINYADLLVKTAMEKIDTLTLLAKKLKGKTSR